MFGLFKKGIEYNNLAKAFDGMFTIVNQVEDKTTEISVEEFNKIPGELMMLAYLCRINIIDRMEKYEWDLMNSIIVPSISSSKITLMHAYNMTIDKLSIVASDMDMLDEIQSVLAKGKHFYEVENSLPQHIKIKLNEGL
jgi:hypothetical protein